MTMPNRNMRDKDKSVHRKLASVRKSAECLTEKLDGLDMEEFQGQSMEALKLLLDALILAIRAYQENNNATI